MSAFAGPSMIENGLVFAYDMGNTNKSWKGAPTTNRVPNATAFSGWTNYYRTLERTSFTTEFGTIGWRFINQPSWSGILIGYTVPSVGTYTFSAYYRYLGSSASNNGGSVYVSGWGGSDVAAYVNKNLVNVWQRVQITVTLTNLTGTFYLISFGGTDSGTTSPDNTSFEVTMPQIEAGSFATPFVDGTRSNAQALLDLSNNNTITLNSLVYNSNNTFNFNGTTNYILGTNNCGLADSITLSAWIKNTYTSGPHKTVICTDVSYQYGAKLMCYKNTERYGLWLGFGSTNYEAFFSQNINDNTIKMLTASWERSTGIVKLYINGNLTSTINSGQTSGIALNDGKICIGGDYYSIGDSTNYEGNIYNTQIFNRVLSSAEVKQNFNALRGRFGI
jgi:hypothetical protein